MKNLIITVLLLSIRVVVGQNTNQYVYNVIDYGNLFNKVNFYTPQAISLMHEVEYPVDPFTGIPDINIPLHSLHIGSKNIDVMLSFHVDSYMKVNQIPGVAGAGWSLGCEYGITRIINGNDDFNPTPWNSTGYPRRQDISRDFTGQVSNPAQQIKSYLHEQYYDGEPDKFYYKIPGKAGAFYYHHNSKNGIYSNEFVTVPYDGVKIERRLSDGRFIITDTDGHKYTFVLCDDSSIPFSSNSAVMTSWKCDSIINAQGITEATFKYDALHTNNKSFSLNNRIEIYDNIINEGPVYITPYAGGSTGQFPFDLRCHSVTPRPYFDIPFHVLANPRVLKCYYNNVSMNPGDNQNIYPELLIGYEFYPGTTPPLYNYSTPNPYQPLIQRIRNLTEISFRGGKIIFIYDSLNYILKTIQVKDPSGNVIKTISLNQLNNNAYDRRLTELLVNDQKYTFAYGSEHSMDYLPDIWGYRTIQDDAPNPNPSQYPVDNPVFMLTSMSMTPVYTPTPNGNSMYGQCGVSNSFSFGSRYSRNFEILKLLTINYPTGGRTDFIVGSNRFSSYRAGGYRIEKIQYFNDATSSVPVKEKIYKYGKSENGTGIIKRLADYSNSQFEQTIRYFYDGNHPDMPMLSEWMSARKRTMVSGSNGSLTFNNGSPVIYPEVAEYETENGSLSGKKVYKLYIPNFSNSSIKPVYIEPTPQNPYPFEPDEWFLGKTDSVIVYKHNNGNFDWISKKKFHHIVNFNPIMIFRERSTLQTDMIYYGSRFQSEFDHKVRNEIDYYKKFVYNYGGILAGVIQDAGMDTYTKDSVGNIVNVSVRNFYDSSMDVLPSRIEIKNSDNTIYTEHNVYPKDYTGTSTGEGAFIESLRKKNMTAILIEQIKRHNGKVSDAILYMYNTNGTLNSLMKLKNVLSNENVFKLSNKNINDFSNTTAKTVFNKSTYYEPTIKVLRYDAYQNPVCMQNVITGIMTWYVWSYLGQYPVATIENATESQVLAAFGGATPESFSSSIAPSISIFGNLHTNSNLIKANVSTYTYKPLVGMTSKKDNNGIITYYEYDGFGRLKQSKDANGKVLEQYDYHYKP